MLANGSRDKWLRFLYENPELREQALRMMPPRDVESFQYRDGENNDLLLLYPGDQKVYLAEILARVQMCKYY